MQNKNDLVKKIGNRLKELRQDHDLTLKKLAEATGLSPALLSRIENALSMPSIHTLQSIADSLNVDMGFFLRTKISVFMSFLTKGLEENWSLKGDMKLRC